jgi:hypothetical protein
MLPQTLKAVAEQCNVKTLQRRLKRSSLYVRLDAITGSGNVLGRIAAFEGWRKSPYDLLAQVYAPVTCSQLCQ